MNAMPKIRDFDDATYDPYTASERIAGTGAVGDVYPELRRMRQIAPIWEVDIREHFGSAPDLGLVGLKKFTVIGHKEISTILSDTTMFSNKIYEKNLGVAFGPTITVMDPPEHSAYRLLFQKAFTPGMIAGWGKTVIPESINRVIDNIADKGKGDLERELALVFPFTFISELLKLPEGDRAVFQKLAFAQTTVRFDPEHGREAGEKLRQYLTDLVNIRRDNPVGDDDFITILANAKVEGKQIPEIILISFLRQLMNAGGDTSFHGFSSLLAALLRHPDQLEAVKKDRALVAPAIEEALRWEAPILVNDRTPLKEVTMGGVTMSPGDPLSVTIGAANRDETIYEDPDTFNIFRKQVRHMAFGYGPHVCIGQHLARLEMTTALNLVLDRMPNLRLDPDKPVPTTVGLTTRKPKAVWALWG